MIDLPTGIFGAVLEVKPLPVGLSGAPVEAVATERGSFVVKRHGNPHAVAMQQLAADHGVAPPVRHVEGLVTVSDLITGPSFVGALSDPESRALAFASVAERLATLRAIPTGGITTFDPRPMATAVWGHLVTRPGFPAWATPLATRLPALLDAWDAEPQRVFAHADLNPGNLVWDGARAWLVDWERAELAHPLLDLATFANFLRLPDETALGLAHGVDRAAFQAIRGLVRLVYGAVFLELVPDLTAVGLHDLATTPDLGAAYGILATGSVAMGTPPGQALMGAAMLKEALLHA